MLAAITLAAALVLGQAQPAEAPKAKEDTFTPEERKQALEALSSIAKTFEAKPQELATKAPQKTMADVADKALDISTKYIGQVAGVLEKAAPRVWAIMVKQQYAKAIGEVIGPIIWLVISILISVFIRSFWKVPEPVDRHDDERVFRNVCTLVIPGIIGLIAGGFLASRLADSAMYLVNPEFYAVQDLVRLLLRPGSF